MNIFTRTKQLAELQGLSLSQLSLKAGLSEKTLYRWRTGNPKFETIEQVAKALNVPVNTLLNDTPSEQLLEFETDVMAEPFDLNNPHKVRWDEYQHVIVTGDGHQGLNDNAVITIEYYRVPAGLKSRKGDDNWRVHSVVKIPFGYLDQVDSEFVQEKYRDYQIATFPDIKVAIQQRLGTQDTQVKVLDLAELVQDANRDGLMQVNGQTLPKEAWQDLEALVKKYTE